MKRDRQDYDVAPADVELTHLLFPYSETLELFELTNYFHPKSFEVVLMMAVVAHLAYKKCYLI